MGITSLRKYHSKGAENVTKYKDVAPVKPEVEPEKPIKKARAKRGTAKKEEK